MPRLGEDPNIATAYPTRRTLSSGGCLRQFVTTALGSLFIFFIFNKVFLTNYRVSFPERQMLLWSGFKMSGRWGWAVASDILFICVALAQLAIRVSSAKLVVFRVSKFRRPGMWPGISPHSSIYLNHEWVRWHHSSHPPLSTKNCTVV